MNTVICLIALAPDEAPTGEAALDALTELDQLRARVARLREALALLLDLHDAAGMPNGAAASNARTALQEPAR